MNFCSDCGHAVTLIVPEGDNRPRYTCPQCHAIHYQNPRVIVGCVAEWKDKILLCRRAINPRTGYWTLPAGFMENGETTAQGAARETLEEACAKVDIIKPLALVDIPDVNQVHLMYHARMVDGQFAPGPESLEVELVTQTHIPWESLAFPSVRFAIESYYRDVNASRDIQFRTTTLGRALS